jgi:hypothetical protein
MNDQAFCVNILFIGKYSDALIVTMTQSNVRRERPKRREPPCTICKGTGTIECRICFGRGLYFTPILSSVADSIICTTKCLTKIGPQICRKNKPCQSCHAPQGRMAAMVRTPLIIYMSIILLLEVPSTGTPG